jgi:hypothetical protein
MSPRLIFSDIITPNNNVLLGTSALHFFIEYKEKIGLEDPFFAPLDRFNGSSTFPELSVTLKKGQYHNVLDNTLSNLGQRPIVMISYWCCKNNSIIDNYLKPDHNHALVPCLKDDCPRWKEGEGRGGCILLVKEDIYGRIQSTARHRCLAFLYCIQREYRFGRSSHPDTHA